MEIDKLLNMIIATKVFEIEPTVVSAEFCKEDGTDINIKGRTADISILTLILARRIIKDTAISYENFCEILKRAVEEEMEINEELMRTQALFNDVCIWEKL